MASGMSTFWSDQVLDKVLRGEDFTAPTTLWAAAFNGAGADLNLRNNIITDEVTGVGYLRVEVKGTSGITFSSANNGQSVQSAPIAFPAAGGTWGTVYTLALLDEFSNVFIYGDLLIAQAITSPDVLRIPTSQWIVTL
jgi:hypothetical protein